MARHHQSSTSACYFFSFLFFFYNLPSLSTTGETLTSHVSLPNEVSDNCGKRLGKAEREMFELFVNWREHLADSFRSVWHPHLFICLSLWLVLQYGSWLYSLTVCLLSWQERKEKKNLKDLQLSKPTSQSPKREINKSQKCVFFETPERICFRFIIYYFCFDLSFLLSFHTLHCCVTTNSVFVSNLLHLSKTKDNGSQESV